MGRVAEFELAEVAGAPCSLSHSPASAERRIYVVATVAIIVATFALRLPALFISAIDWDEGVYIVMAQRWLLGELPYVAVWDQHPPGLPALLALVQAFISDPVLGARLSASTAVAVTAVLIYRFCARYANLAGPGLVGALLYAVCISCFAGLASNTEVFNNACVTFAAYQLFGAARRPDGGVPRAVAAAAVLGIGLQIKYVVFPEAALLCLGYLVALRRQGCDLAAVAARAGLLVTVGCLPTGLAIGYFWAEGILGLFWDANVGSNLLYVTMVPALPDIVRFSGSGLKPLVTAILMIGYAMTRGSEGQSQWVALSSPKGWVLLWAVAAGLNVCLPMKFYPHYFFALYPPMCIAAALALAQLAGGHRRAFALGSVALFLTAAPIWMGDAARAVEYAQADASRAVAGFLRAAGAQDMDVFVYDYEPVIYALAGVRPPTPYVIRAELAEFSQSAHVDGVAELQRVMDAMPRFVVVRAGPLSGHAPDLLDDVMAPKLASYRLVQEVTGADGYGARIYER